MNDLRKYQKRVKRMKGILELTLLLSPLFLHSIISMECHESFLGSFLSLNILHYRGKILQ